MSSGWSIAGVVLTWLIAAFQYFFIAVASFDTKGELELFGTRAFPPRSEISTGLTGPLEYIAAGWGVVFILQLVWQIYLSTTLCRRGSDGIAVCELAPYSPAFYIFFYLAAVSSVVRLFFPGIISLLLLGVCGIFMSISLIMAVRHTFIYHDELSQQNLSREYVLEILFMHNSVAAMSTWMSLLTVAQLSPWMTQNFSTSADQNAFYGMCILLVVFVIFVVVDQGLYERETRFIYTPYIMGLFMLIPSILFRTVGFESNTILCGAVVTSITVTFIVKVIIGIVREIRSPMFPSYKKF